MNLQKMNEIFLNTEPIDVYKHLDKEIIKVNEVSINLIYYYDYFLC